MSLMLKSYGWRNPDDDLEFLYAEVNPGNCQISLTVTLGLIERTRELMNDLNNEGALPNEVSVETKAEGSKMVVFTANKERNWNLVWPDLKTVLERTLGIHISELEQNTN